MIFQQKLLVEQSPLPVRAPKPTVIVVQEVARVDLAQFLTGIARKSGWYRINVRATNGGVAYKGTPETQRYGGGIQHAFYMYKGSLYLMWGANVLTTGYPDKSGSGGYISNVGMPGELGGGGAGGTWGQSGSGGGSASGDGAVGSGSSGGYGGAGAGFICGMNLYQPTQSEEWHHNGKRLTFNVDNVECMLLCAGGGGSVSDEGSHRTSGAGGGAWGDGGNTDGGGSFRSGGKGPGGNFGKGGDGVRYGGDTRGGWAIRDFTQNIHISGLGLTGGNTNWLGPAVGWPNEGVCILEYLGNGDYWL